MSIVKKIAGEIREYREVFFLYWLLCPLWVAIILTLETYVRLKRHKDDWYIPLAALAVDIFTVVLVMELFHWLFVPYLWVIAQVTILKLRDELLILDK